jgi:hypothetical protein
MGCQLAREPWGLEAGDDADPEVCLPGGSADGGGYGAGGHAGQVAASEFETRHEVARIGDDQLRGGLKTRRRGVSAS